MKTFDLPSNSNYGDQPIPIAFPDNWDVHISKIHGYDTPALTEAQIAEKIHAAIGAKPISEGAAGKKSAVIIIDDITRPTPCEPIAKAVIAELRAAGVPKENIWFIIALGTHGVMYRTEFVRKLGEEIVENYEVHNHNLFFNHVFVGNTSNNVPVEINADVMSADYKIAIGTTMAHSYYGFSGGAKCILPGVSSLRTIMRNHSFTTTTEFNMGNPHTLMRSDAEQAARMMGLDFKIDAILNGHAQICNLFAGDFEAEIQHAAAYAAEHYAAKFVPDCDVVIANNYFKPAEANCAYTPEVIASLKDGGSFVLAANSPFGPCVHFLYDKWGHSAPGGMMWSGCYTKGKNMAHAVVFAEHTVKGMRDPWYIDEHSGAEYVKTWNDALRILDDGTPKKVVLYPNARAAFGTVEPDTMRRLAALEGSDFAGVIANNLAQFGYASPLPVFGGLGLNVTNPMSAAEYVCLGARGLLVQPETALTAMRAVAPRQKDGTPVPTAALCYGHLPLMLTRACPLRNVHDCASCRGGGTLRDRKGRDFTVTCSAPGGEGIRTVYNPVTL